MMERQVGKSTDDYYAMRNRDRVLFVSEQKLPNGNVEEEFRMGRGPTCRVFFEINNDAQKIVGWRYIGTENDCAFPP